MERKAKRKRSTAETAAAPVQKLSHALVELFRSKIASGELKPGDTLRIPKGVPHQARTRDQAFRALIVYDTPTRVMVPVTAKKPAAKP